MLKAAYETTILATRNDGTHPFTINMRLSRERTAAAERFSRGPLEHLRREIKRKLEARFQRSFEFWLTAEFGGAKTGYKLGLHLHGAIGLQANENRNASDLLKLIAGGEARAVKLEPIDDPRSWVDVGADRKELIRRVRHNPPGWGRYALKNIISTPFYVRGSLFTDTAELKNDGEALWEYHRSLLLSKSRTDAECKCAGK